MVDSPAEYVWSSYQANGLGKHVALHTPHPEYLQLGSDAQDRERAYRALFRAHLGVNDDALIREATKKGLAVGSERFK